MVLESSPFGSISRVLEVPAKHRVRHCHLKMNVCLVGVKEDSLPLFGLGQSAVAPLAMVLKWRKVQISADDMVNWIFKKMSKCN
ncbi:hypothetical protein RRG08_014407 [Elysia crispata]|uniref:Uncharacterized protein n=1 Tax=Elysia crispata TaxID=231223 RepID=A0AAE0YWB8_9GAST|nr:hypothetical protein RRG08_014407 [Elysia crispata]